MTRNAFSSVTEQVVDLLREGMQTGRWSGALPGRDRLARELCVSHTTIEAAMRSLAKEGWLVSQGAGRRRRIVLPQGQIGIKPRHFKVRILAYEPEDRKLPFVIELLHRLNQAEFQADFAARTLLDLGMNVNRFARLVQRDPADAWIVIAGSREVLEWLCARSVPAFALFGIKSGLSIAGIGIRRDTRSLIRLLVQRGHRRIVMLSREERLKPKPALMEQGFLDNLVREGITPGSYNLPAWGYRPEGLHRCLESLFHLTPPTALIINEAPIFLAARDHLARRGIIAPRDVSLICIDHDESFSWCDPEVAHFTWDPAPIVRRVLRWAENVSHGKEDRRQSNTKARFVEGGTIGPAGKG